MLWFVFATTLVLVTSQRTGSNEKTGSTVYVSEITERSERTTYLSTTNDVQRIPDDTALAGIENSGNLGDPCYNATDCYTANSTCTSKQPNVIGKCVCDRGYFNDSSSCVKRYFGESCNSDSECYGEYMSCYKNKCLCEYGYFNVSSLCEERFDRMLGESCFYSEDCEGDLICDWTGSKKMGTCVCDNGYVPDNTTCLYSADNLCRNSTNCILNKQECLWKHQMKRFECGCPRKFPITIPKGPEAGCYQGLFGEPCYNLTDCRNANGICKDPSEDEDRPGRCVCLPDHFNNPTVCVKKRNILEYCESADQCADPIAICSGPSINPGRKYCMCPDGYFANGTVCLIKLNLDEDCFNNLACKDPQATCTGSQWKRGKCLCQAGYFNFNSRCTSRSDRQLSESCFTNSNCQAGNTECRGGSLYSNITGTCDCQVKYVRSGQNCVYTSGAFGEKCFPNYVCRETSMECKGASSSEHNPGTCVCRAGYIRSSSTCVRTSGALGERCYASYDCKGVFTECRSASSSEHKPGTCACRAGYIRSESTCVRTSGNIGEPCYNSWECVDSNSKCEKANSNLNRPGKCVCEQDYFQVISKCQKGNPGDTCQYDSQCKNQVTSSCEYRDLVKKCTCTYGYFQYGTECETSTSRKLGDSCFYTYNCWTTFSECRGASFSGKKAGTCACSTGYYRSGSSCEYNSTSPGLVIGIVVGICILIALSVAAACWRRVRIARQRNNVPTRIVMVPRQPQPPPQGYFYPTVFQQMPGHPPPPLTADNPPQYANVQTAEYPPPTYVQAQDTMSSTNVPNIYPQINNNNPNSGGNHNQAFQPS